VFATSHTGSLGFTCQRGTMMQWGKERCDGRVSPAKCAACELQHRGLPRPVADAVGLVPPAVGRLFRRVPGKLGTTLGMSDLVARNAALQADVLSQVERFLVLTDWAQRAVAANDGVGAPIVLNRLGVRASAADIERARAIPRVRRPHLTVAYLGRFERIKGVHDLARAVRSLGRDVPIRVEFRGPVIATRMTAMTEVIEDGVNGRLLPPGDWRALAKALREIAADPAGTIGRWSTGLPPVRTMDDVTADHLRMYGACDRRR
jgi:glycosyltransferase involved in cell wall biosynthesis